MKIFKISKSCLIAFLICLVASLVSSQSLAWKPARTFKKTVKEEPAPVPVVKEVDIIPGYQDEKNIQRRYSSKSLHRLIEELLTYNPELRSLVDKINASKDKVDYAATLDDPRFSFDVVNVPTGNASLSRTPMSGIQIYLRQKVPFPAKLVTRKKLARSQHEQARQIYLEKLNQLVAKFKKVYYDYAYVSEIIYIHEKNRRRLNALVGILEARYATGKSPQQDVLRTKVEANNIKNIIIELSHYRKVLLARLNTLLVRPPQTPLKVVRARSAYRTVSLNLPSLIDLAQTNRPWLKNVDSQVEEARQARILAQEGLLPDFDFGVGYRFRNSVAGDPVIGQDFVSAGVSVNIPFLWTLPRHSKEISEFKNRERSQKRFKDSLIQEVIYQVSQAYHEIRQLRSQINLYRNQIIPESIATVESSMFSYEAEQVDYLNLITSQLQLFNHEISYVKYRYEHDKKVADLEAAVGRPFDFAQGKPFDIVQGKPFDIVQGKPFDIVQGKPFDIVQGKP